VIFIILFHFYAWSMVTFIMKPYTNRKRS